MIKWTESITKHGKAQTIPWQQGSWGQNEAHLGPIGPRWAPCWSIFIWVYCAIAKQKYWFSWADKNMIKYRILKKMFAVVVISVTIITGRNICLILDNYSYMNCWISRVSFKHWSRLFPGIRADTADLLAVNHDEHYAYGDVSATKSGEHLKWYVECCARSRY